jgi:hypothetical protein
MVIKKIIEEIEKSTLIKLKEDNNSVIKINVI